MSFPAYDQYKDSGFQWLGDIPSHWQLSAVRYAFENLDFKRVPLSGEHRSDVEKIYPYYGASGIIDYVDNYIFNEPLILVAEDGANLLSRSTPLAFIASGKYWVNNHAHILRPIEGDLRFWECLLQIYDYTPIVTGAAQPKLTAEQLAGIRLPLPPLDEQQVIASFLDSETSKIDGLVSEQRRLIKLLKEKRQAVISHAVTKGLNRDAPMKPSGIQWLGDVPEHWEMKRLKHVSRFISVGIVVNPTSYVSEDENALPFIYGGDIREGVIDWANSRRIHPDLGAIQEKTRLEAGDLLVVRVGAPGVTAVVPAECEGGNCASVMLMRKGDFNSHWLCYVMNTRVVRFQVEVVAYGAAQKQFNIAHAVNFWVPVPDRAEQDELVAQLDKQVGEFDELQADAERAIVLLQERRTALISAAVTGKIDVREFAYQETA